LQFVRTSVAPPPTGRGWLEEMHGLVETDNNVSEVVALIRQQAALEMQIMNAAGPAVAAEWALATTRRRLVAYPEALAAVLNTARALRRSPDMVSVRDVTAFGGSN
jgi:hypothetical protein